MNEYQKIIDDIFKNGLIILTIASLFLFVRGFIIKSGLKFYNDKLNFLLVNKNHLQRMVELRLILKLTQIPTHQV